MRAFIHNTMTVRTPTVSLGVLALAAIAARCGSSGSPTSPTQPPFPVVAETASFRYHQRLGMLQPLDRIVTTSAFRALTDSVVSYRVAGSFVRFTIDRYGLPRVLDFFRSGSRTDDLATIRARFLSAFGTTLDDAEREWRSMLTTVG